MDNTYKDFSYREALNHIDSGNETQAMTLLKALAETSPENDMYCHRYVSLLIDTGNFDKAINFIKTKKTTLAYNDFLCRIYNITGNEDAEIEFLVASAEQRIKHEKYVFGVIKKLENKLSNRYNSVAFKLALKLTKSHPEFIHGWQALARLSMYTDNWEQAELAYLRLLSFDEKDERSLNAYNSLLARKTISMNPNQTRHDENSHALSLKFKSNKNQVTMARYPIKDELFKSFRDIFSTHVALEFNLNPPKIETNDKFITFGSCFASNVATALTLQGKSVWHIPIGEDINNTYTNKFFWQWVCGHKIDSNIQDNLTKLINISRREVIQKLRDAKCFIYTLGLGAGFFSKHTGEALVPESDWVGTRALIEQGEFKTTSIDENTDNIIEIINLIRQINPEAKIIITLSPVPLLATFERHSAVIADCLSKSVLRVAIHEVMKKKINGVYYWPSFEAVRWLAPHIGKFYGGDDGVSRHINESVINDIISVFVESVSGGVVDQIRR